MRISIFRYNSWSVCLSLHPSVYAFVCMSFHCLGLPLPVCYMVHLFFYLTVNLSFRLPVHLSAGPSVCVRLFLCQFPYKSIILSVCSRVGVSKCMQRRRDGAVYLDLIRSDHRRRIVKSAQRVGLDRFNAQTGSRPEMMCHAWNASFHVIMSCHFVKPYPIYPWWSNDLWHQRLELIGFLSTLLKSV